MYAYLAFKGLEKNLEEDLKSWDSKWDRLYLSTINCSETYWAQLNLGEVFIFDFNSITEAVKHLKSINHYWCVFPVTHFRRAQLIQDQIIKVKSIPWNFMDPKIDKFQEQKWGFWTLLDKNKLLYSKKFSAIPLNEIIFNEDKIAPPSRAYLKLWELFTIHKIMPHPYSNVIDLGSSPGGWTWVLSQICNHVTSIDRSPLENGISSFKNVSFKQGDIFNLNWSHQNKFDWLFCDVICFPEKILENIQIWLKNNIATNYVVTIKFKERPNMQVIQELEKIEFSKLIHLNHNKNELTWILYKDKTK